MSAAYDWMDYSERMLRERDREAPRRHRTAPIAGWLDDDARNRDVRLRVETRVIVEGDEITIDLTRLERRGADRLQRARSRARSSSAATTPCARSCSTRSTFPEHVPQNDGVFRPVKVIAPKGTIFNPTFPRALLLALLPDAAGRRQRQSSRSPTRCPTSVTAGNSAGIHFCAYSGFDEEMPASTGSTSRCNEARTAGAAARTRWTRSTT